MGFWHPPEPLPDQHAFVPGNDGGIVHGHELGDYGLQVQRLRMKRHGLGRIERGAEPWVDATHISTAGWRASWVSKVSV